MENRVVHIEYIITRSDNKQTISCWRRESDLFIGDFKSVENMKAYCNRLYNLNKVVYHRLYEKEVQDGEEV